MDSTRTNPSLPIPLRRALEYARQSKGETDVANTSILVHGEARERAIKDLGLSARLAKVARSAGIGTAIVMRREEQAARRAARRVQRASRKASR